ncbi:Bromodomain-containing protein [Peniophora sp. CONT]|nr:Bromodomain-containing protein [Peniophora sp. CONT]
MPRAHIIRTLFSQHTQCLAIVARGFVVRAGLAYHVLPQRGFAELVFVAAREEDRAKGYAAFLMRELRWRLRVQTPKMDAILAYADNGARGWFTRQGFGEVTLPHERWAGYIRDYDGAQLVQTYVHAFGEEVFEKNHRGEVITVQGVPRCKLPLEAGAEQWIVQTQHYAVRTEMYKRRPATGLVYSGLTFRPGEVKDPESIPGLAGRGLARHMYCAPQMPRVQRLRRLLMLLVDTMKADAASEPFLHPVDVSIAPGYNDLITEPMDLGTLQANVRAGVYDPVGQGVKAFISDATRIFDNCRAYNGDCSLYTVKAERLRRKLEKAVEKWKHIVCEVEEKTFIDVQMYR